MVRHKHSEFVHFIYSWPSWNMAAIWYFRYDNNVIQRRIFGVKLYDNDGRPRTRAIIVRFRSERVRDEVFRARTKLKSHNAERRTDKIFINDDLTPRRAKLSFDARASKRANKITDCWTAYGRVMIKDLAGKGAATLYDSLVRSLPIALYMGQS